MLVCEHLAEAATHRLAARPRGWLLLAAHNCAHGLQMDVVEQYLSALALDEEEGAMTQKLLKQTAAEEPMGVRCLA